MTEANGDTGSKDRATVALAVEKIDGLKALTAAGFSEVHRRLDAVEGLPVEVADLKARVKTLEDDGAWRRVHLPSFILSALAIAVAALALFL